jgi:hypothetical protein
MDPFTVHLALGCVLSFSHMDTETTEAFGQSPDGVYYRQVNLVDAKGRKQVLAPPRAKQAYTPGTMFRVGRSPDGLYASFLVLRQGAGRNEQDVRFVAATTCSEVRFVRVRDGRAVDASSHDGWLKGGGHSVRLLGDGTANEVALPLEEAVRQNPALAGK